VLVLLNRIHPLRPPAVRLRLGPATVRLQHAVQPDDPGRYLHVHKAHLRTQEERTGFVGGVDELGDLGLELLGIGDLFGLVLFLKKTVETWDDVAVDLSLILSFRVW